MHGPTNSTLTLAPGEIHLWLAFREEIADERLYSSYDNLLSHSERARARRFHFTRDSRTYLMTRALVRTVLSRYAAVSPEDWVFSANAYGRPTIDNAAAREARLSFNVSHSDGLVVLGVTKDCALGVDVERVSSREIPMDIANHYFAPTEVAALAEVPPYRQQYRFFEYWTFKESYIKARGMGLSLPLDKFSFRFPNDDTVEIDIHPALNDASRWQFWQFEPAADYLLAVCAEQTGGPSRSVVLRQIVPMMRETELAPRLLRALR